MPPTITPTPTPPVKPTPPVVIPPTKPNIIPTPVKPSPQDANIKKTTPKTKKYARDATTSSSSTSIDTSKEFNKLPNLEPRVFVLPARLLDTGTPTTLLKAK